MNVVVLGATGHVGSAVATALLEQEQAVTVVTRDADRGTLWEQRGATVAVADVADVAALRDVLASGSRAFILNPPADPSTDTDVEERRTVAAIVAALEGSGLEKMVVASTYGARPGERCGDLSVLHELEQGALASGIPTVINRGAYYFSNWDGSADTARDDGVIYSMFPDDFVMPMVAPGDLGVAGARRLLEPVEASGIHFLEGPRRYSPGDVAAMIARVLDRQVEVVTVPPSEHRATFKSMGFSDAAADAYACMTDVALRGDYEMPDSPERGETKLETYITNLISDTPDA
jgi:uncharacterized protein YbjT (DUF2867 family)